MEIVFLVIIVLLLIFNIYLVFKNKKRGENEELVKLSNSIANFEIGSDKNFSRIEISLKDEIGRNREETSKNAKETREEISTLFKNLGDSINSRMSEIANLQKNQLDVFALQLTTLTKTNEEKLERMRETIEIKLKSLQDDNNIKLEKMRETVDEKLHSTLEKRLGESFKIVSDRLELVHKGLGEMQNLATGVGDLKKVLSNVKSKGILGEYQLANLLDQILTIEQYGKNVKTKKGSNDMVEFAVKMPGDEKGSAVWLPIDSKLPTEDYMVLMDAYDKGDVQLIESTKKQLSSRIKLFARYIREKYIDPPNTTDFGIMFLPYEGLYAEVLRIPGLFESIQRELKITITGPTTLSALLNSLQIGFRTLAIEKRTSEIWTLLGAVKTEFGSFATVLERTKEKLDKASSEIDKASIRSRSIERKLRDVQDLPQGEVIDLLEPPPINEELFKDETENGQ